MDDQDELLLAVFAEESAELVARIARSLVAAEHATATAPKEALTPVLRDLHTLKGCAGAVGYLDATAMCHAMEELAGARARSRPTAADFDLLHRSTTWLRLRCGGEPGLDAAPLLAALAEATATQPDTAAAPAALPVAAPTAAQATVAPAGSAVPANAERTQPAAGAPAATSVPDAGLADADGAPPPTSASRAGGQHPEALAPLTAPAAAAMEPEADGQAANPARRSAAAKGVDSLRVALHRIDGLQSSVDDLLIAQLGQHATRSQLMQVLERSEALVQAYRKLFGSMRDLRHVAAAPVWSKLEAQMYDFASQLNGLDRDAALASAKLDRQLGQLDLTAKALDHGLRTLRMTPLGPWFDAFGPSVRDAARQVDRDVRLVVEPCDIEVDRATLEALREPVLHLLRNAVAHGAEPAEVRLAAGKAAWTEIRVSAERVGERVRIAIADDGRGVDRQAVARKAVAARILTHAAELDDTRLLEVLAHVGLSTAQRVNQVAGRGIGMNVVVDALQQVGGALTLCTRQGVGATFELAVPVLSTTATGVAVAVGPYRLAIPTQHIDRLLRVNGSEIGRVDQAPVVQVDGQPVAYASLADLLGVADPEHQPTTDGKVKLVVLRSGRQRLAVRVDDVLHDLPMVIKPLGPQFERLLQYCGCTIDADGAPLLVVEVRELLRIILRAGPSARGALRGASAGPTAQAAAAVAQKTILVVDDSITTRTLERNVLESAGYKVVTACDGQDALEQLAKAGGFDLMVTDVDMPRMDGFELCQRVRAGNHSHMPVVMVTSRHTEQERLRGAQCGADAYLIKRDFDQVRFVGTVERLLA